MRLVEAREAARAGAHARGAALAAPLGHLLERLLAHLAVGSIRVRLPDGRELAGRGRSAGPAVQMTLHRWRALMRLALQGDAGLAQSYLEGDWSTPDLRALLDFGARNDAGWQGALDGARWLRRLGRVARAVQSNTRVRSRRNAAYHYDLGNDFYRLWLDADLVYSSALFGAGAATLEAAQAAKMARVMELLRLPEQASAGQASLDVLEIGCGWGALACALARRGGVRLTGLTLSTEQLAWAKERVARAGLAERVDLRLQDYRDVRGGFDRIVSIEMIEAVGEAHWPQYFRALHERLRPGGSAVIQAITIDDAFFAHYRRTGDFIQRYVFPGGMLPCASLMLRHARAAGLRATAVEYFGASYARTLAEWQRRFQAAWPQIAALGFDAAFKRLWEYYLSYCEAGFGAGRINVGLFSFERAAA